MNKEIAFEAINDFLNCQKINIQESIIDTLKIEIDKLGTDAQQDVINDLRNKLDLLKKVESFVFDDGEKIFDWLYEYYGEDEEIEV